ncbi:MAG TPA: SPOR domain-containing protein, partial [Clostridiales bacterium]|nr:SPOR domain-containing protein [Clostridiales bacterium]
LYNADKMAKAIFEGIAKTYPAVKKQETKPAEQSGTGKMYKVQIGAFNSRANAEKLAAELKSKGYDPFIVEA